MAKVHRSKPILLTSIQLAAIEKIQEQERQKSPYGAAPSIQDIARGLMDKAIAEFVGEETNA